jgi:hypothetical protein
MVRLELTTDEARSLRGILESYLSDLKTERLHTDNRELRQAQKSEEDFVSGLLSRMHG